MAAGMAERKVWAHLLTARGWILAAVRLPERLTLPRHLNGAGRMLHLAEVASGWWRPGAAPPSIAKAHVLLIVPQVDERVAPSPARGRGVVWNTTFLLAKGQVTGRFDARRGLSPAGYLERVPCFVVLEGARLRLPSSPTFGPGTLRSALVNTAAVVAVAARREARA